MRIINKSSMYNFNLAIVAMLLLSLGSCVSNKDYVLLQNNEKGDVKLDSNSQVLLISNKYKIQNGDILYITITTEDDRLNKIFAPNTSGGSNNNLMQGGGNSGSLFYYTGYTVNNEGYLEFPYLGRIKASGLTTEQVQTSISNEVGKLFKQYYVMVKMAEFKFSIIGEIKRPGQFYFAQNKVSIIEALALAGDLTDLADRKKIKLFRQTEKGVREYTIDITDKKVMFSDLFFLQPNDVIYIMPLPIRSIGNLTSAQNTIGFIVPLLSTLLVVVNTYILISKL